MKIARSSFSSKFSSERTVMLLVNVREQLTKWQNDGSLERIYYYIDVDFAVAQATCANVVENLRTHDENRYFTLYRISVVDFALFFPLRFCTSYRFAVYFSRFTFARPNPIDKCRTSCDIASKRLNAIIIVNWNQSTRYVCLRAQCI